MRGDHHVVIVGASIAGLTTAETLRSRGFVGPITLIGDEPHLPYRRPPLSKQVLLSGWTRDQLSVKTAPQLDALEVAVRTNTSATGVDIRRRVLTTTTGECAYDELVIATGTRARHPGIEGVLTLRTVDDGFRLRDALADARRVVVLGVGVLGSEIASAARHRGAEVSLHGRSAALSFGTVGTALSGRLAQLHRDAGVAVCLSSAVVDIEREGHEKDAAQFRVSFSDDQVVRADLVVAAIGATPAVEWLEGSGLTLDNGIVCDHRGAAASGIYAVGDVAAWADPVTGRPSRVEHQSNAIEQAISVAQTIVQGRAAPPPTPFFWSQIHGVDIKAYGWFSSEEPLTVIDSDPTGDRLVLGATPLTGRVGIVGWNATPRAFRAARAEVDKRAASASSISQEREIPTKECL